MNSPDRITTTPGGRVLTQHALDSLIRHGFQPPFDQVDDIIDHATRTTNQTDGAIVHIQRSGTRRKRYNIIIEGVEGIVTGLRNLSRHELENLGKNYGFEPFE
jgi:filamentous hemagglutinin